MIISSVKTLSQREGPSDKNREQSFKFLNSIMAIGFKFPENLLKSIYEISIGVNMSEALPEFIILTSTQTLNRLIDVNPKFIIHKEHKKILLAFIDRFKYFIRNWEKYSKDIIEEFLKVMLKLSSLLDYDGIGTIFPFLSVTTVKALIYIIPGVNGMIQTYLMKIWQIACLKVLGDKSFFVQKYFQQDIEEIKLSK